MKLIELLPGDSTMCSLPLRIQTRRLQAQNVKLWWILYAIGIIGISTFCYVIWVQRDSLCTLTRFRRCGITYVRVPA